MSENVLHPAGVYVKGDRSVVAQSPASAVALVFDGFTLAEGESKSESEDSVDEGQTAEKPAPKPSAPRGGNPKAPVTDNRDAGTDPSAVIPPA